MTNPTLITLDYDSSNDVFSYSANNDHPNQGPTPDKATGTEVVLKFNESHGSKLQFELGTGLKQYLSGNNSVSFYWGSVVEGRYAVLDEKKLTSKSASFNETINVPSGSIIIFYLRDTSTLSSTSDVGTSKTDSGQIIVQ